MIGLGLGFGLGLTPNSGVFEGLDPNAKGYINAVVAAGGTVSGTQKSAINTFVKTGKSDGWYSSLKRLYLPIWGVAAPNAIDMMELGSGTFNGTVTHGAGYVQGDGSTGYFSFLTSLSSLGISSGSALIGCLVKSPSANNAGETMLGVTDLASDSELIRQSTSSNIQGRFTTSGQQINGGNNRDGILTYCAFPDNSRNFRRRSSSGAASLGTSAGEAAFVLEELEMFALCRNGSGSANEFTAAQMGAYFATLGMDVTTTDAFTLALKNLWEGATNLVLP